MVADVRRKGWSFALRKPIYIDDRIFEDDDLDATSRRKQFVISPYELHYFDAVSDTRLCSWSGIAGSIVEEKLDVGPKPSYATYVRVSFAVECRLSHAPVTPKLRLLQYDKTELYDVELPPVHHAGGGFRYDSGRVALARRDLDRVSAHAELIYPPCIEGVPRS